MKENNEEEKNNEGDKSIRSQSAISEYTIRSSSLSSVGSQMSTNNNALISLISNIIQFFKNKNDTNENNEEIIEQASQKLLEMSSNHNIDILSIKDSLNNNLISFYCSSQDYLNLKIILYTIEKQKQKINIDTNLLNNYFLSENNDNMNVFEISSELGDIKLFNILKKYLIGNNSLLNCLIKPKRDNVFHIAAKNNQIISLLFYYSFYKNSDCLQIPNEQLKTSLHISCQKNYYDFSRVLVNLGINMDLQDKKGKTAMFYAVEKQNIKIVKNLILNGANKNIKDNNNNKCIDYPRNNIDNDNDNEDNKNLKIFNILEDKSICVKAFKCPIIYQSLKGRYEHILMIISIILIIILQSTILFFFLYYKYKYNINKDINKNNEEFFKDNHIFIFIEFILVIASLLSEMLIILIFSIFSCDKKNKQKTKR